MKTGIMSPCSNPISVKNFSYAGTSRSRMKVKRRKTAIGESDGDSVSLQYMSQHQLEKQMNLEDQISVNSITFKGKELNLEQLKGELENLNKIKGKSLS
jgi:hypothetical protein